MPELYYWIDKEGSKEHYDNERMDLVIIATPDKVKVYEMDRDDGYRSHCNEYVDYDNVTLWAKCEADLQNRRTVVYDRIEYDFHGTEKKGNQNYSYSEEVEVFIKAWRDGKVVFEIGTNNTDDYYPRFFMNVEGEEIY